MERKLSQVLRYSVVVAVLILLLSLSVASYAAQPVFVNGGLPAINATNLNTIAQGIHHPYDAMVYISGTTVRAIDQTGCTISTGTTGTDDAAVIQAALDYGERVYVEKGTYNTEATLLIKKHGQVLYGAGTGDIRNTATLGEPGTVFKPKAGVSIGIQIKKTGDYVTGFQLNGFSVDMTNMADTADSIGILQNSSYMGVVDTVAMLNFGANKISYKASAGAYATNLINCNIDTLHLIGQSQINNAATTFYVQNCNMSRVYMRNANTNTFIADVFQGDYDKFDMDNVDGVSIYACDVEGGGKYLKLGSSVINLQCYGNQFSGFYGTYQSGTPSGGRNTIMDTIPAQILNRGLNITEGPLNVTYTSGLNRNNLATGDASSVDIKYSNSVGLMYAGLNSAGDSKIDNRGSGTTRIQNGGTDIVTIYGSNNTIRTTSRIYARYLTLTSGVLNITTDDYITSRVLLENTNATPLSVDIEYKNAAGTMYAGLNGAGDTKMDNRGTGITRLQYTGNDVFVVNGATGNVEVTGAAKGVVVKTPDGAHTYRISVDNNGTIISTLVS